MTTKNNMLTQIQSYKLTRWLDDDQVMAANHTAVDLASMASKQLGFVITDHNVRSARESLGIKPTTRGRGRRFNVSGKRVFSNDILAGEIIAILEALQMPVSENLQAIASRKKIDPDLFDY